MAAKKVTASLLTDNPNLKFKEILARGATRRPNGFDLLAAFGRRELAGASARYYLLAKSAGCTQPPYSIPAGTRTPLSVLRSCVEPLAARYPFPNTPGPTRGIRTSMRRVPGVYILPWSPGPTGSAGVSFIRFFLRHPPFARAVESS